MRRLFRSIMAPRCSSRPSRSTRRPRPLRPRRRWRHSHCLPASSPRAAAVAALPPLLGPRRSSARTLCPSSWLPLQAQQGRATTRVSARAPQPSRCQGVVAPASMRAHRPLCPRPRRGFRRLRRHRRCRPRGLRRSSSQVCGGARCHRRFRTRRWQRMSSTLCRSGRMQCRRCVTRTKRMPQRRRRAWQSKLPHRRCLWPRTRCRRQPPQRPSPSSAATRS
mmetsp:Transcript_79863/g.178921  ORF Transcript_79863/g.178921 Transcript_79863/m.178921 type:complete len:221 (+) Transcript_79863:206-868(+)